MYEHIGFFQDNVKVFLRGGDVIEDKELIKKDGTGEFKDIEKNISQSQNPFYTMTYISKGSAIMKNGTFDFKAAKNTLVFAKSNVKVGMKIIPENNKFKYITISFLPQFLPASVSDDDYLRAFHNLPDEKRHIHDDPLLNELFKIMEHFVIHSYEQFYVHSILQAIIARLCVLCDELEIYYPDTDSVYGKIIKYLKRNFSNIKNIKEIEEKFFVSSNTLEKIVKLYTNRSVWEYITDLRVEYANRLIEKGQYSVSECAELAGFESYTAFYRNYKKHYGISPSEKQKQKKDGRNWPLKI